MGQKDKKKRKLLAKRLKQRKFIAKYGFYNIPGKFIPKESEAKEDEPQIQEKSEPQKPGIAEQLKQQRPVMSSNLQSWLDGDDDIEKENVGLDANDQKKEATEREVEDPMAELKATILNDKTKAQPERQGLSKEDAERLNAQKDNVLAMGQEVMTKEEMDQMILSSLSVDRVFTKEETKQIDEQVAQAKKDSLGENDPAFVSHTKADLHDVFLPHVEFDDEKEVNPETKDQPINLTHSKVLLYDDSYSQINPDTITYEINENVINSGNDSINTHTLNMPAYNSYWIKHIEKDSVTQPVRSELNNILKAAGVKENDASALADDIHGPLSQTVAFDNSIDRQNINMSDMAAMFFKDSYAAIDKANLSSKNRIIAAQKIADLMIRNYSPVAFVKGDELGQYTDKYVVQNKVLLKDQLEKLNVQNVEALISGVEEALENGFEYDQSEPAIDPNSVQNVNNEQHVANPEAESLKPRIPDFYQKLGERMDSEDITAQAMSEIKDIIKEAGITDDKRITELSDASYSFVKKQINSIYDKETVPETKMSKDTPTFFRNAYESLNGSDLSTQAQIIAAQKIANVMLKNYSPVAFIGEGLEHYANDYVLNNRDVFKSQLDMLRLYNAEALMDDVDAARGVYPQIENEDTEFTRWLNGRIESTAVFGSVYNELSDILNNAGFTEQDEVAALVRFTQHYGSRTIIDSPHLDGDNPNMHDISVQFFEDSYQMIERAGLSPKDRIITAQKISDVMLKNYSPVATKSGEFGAYADNYVLRNATLLRERLEKLDVKNIDTLLTDRDIASLNGSENRSIDMINGVGLRENPSVFMLDKARNEKAIPDIRNILVEAGITEDAAQNLEVGDILEDAYSRKNIPAASISMRDVAKNIFVSTYDELTKKDLAPNNKIETVQKIADVILKNYSPVINNKALDKYAQNYVTGDKTLLRECLTTLKVPEDEIKEIVGDENPDIKNEVTPEVKNDTAQKKAAPKSFEDKMRHYFGNNEAVDKYINSQNEARVAVFAEKLKAYNNMYKLDINGNDFVASVTEAWELMTSGDNQKLVDGKRVMNNLIKDTLKKAFDVEKDVAYDEHRLPEYVEIIRSTNELMRSAMYGFTDMYHNPNRNGLFNVTAFGGLNAKDMGDLTAGDSLWSKDQKSNEAWDIQSKEAKNIADKWLKEDKPYEKMISEMKALIVANKDGIISRKETLDKLTAAEWLLENNEKMMIDDPKDPLNPIPNWGNRYWEAITETREALGIDKHTSMRDLIQSDYAAMAKAVGSANYNKTQIQLYVLDKDVRELSDSMEFQKEQFATLSADAVIKEPKNIKTSDDHKNEIRWREPVESENERKKLESSPKDFGSKVVENDKEKKIEKDANVSKT